MARHTAKSHKIRKVEILVIQILIFLNCYSLQMMCVVEMTHCERNVRSPGTSRERAFSDIRVLVPLDRGLSASGSSSQPVTLTRPAAGELSWRPLFYVKASK